MASAHHSLLVVHFLGFYYSKPTSHYMNYSLIYFYISAFPINQDNMRRVKNCFPLANKAALGARALSCLSHDVGRQSGHTGVKEQVGWGQEGERKVTLFLFPLQVCRRRLYHSPSAPAFCLPSCHSSQCSWISQIATTPLRRLLKTANFKNCF